MIALLLVLVWLLTPMALVTALLFMPVAWLLDTALLWVLYLSIMHLQYVRDRGPDMIPPRTLPDQSIPYGKKVLYAGLLQDFLYNMTWACLMYFDYPREWLVTARLKRYKYGADTAAWRLNQTNYYAAVMLDPFDESGLHV